MRHTLLQNIVLEKIINHVSRFEILDKESFHININGYMDIKQQN